MLPYLFSDKSVPTAPQPEIPYPDSEDYVLCRNHIEPIEYKNKLSFIFNDQLLLTDYSDIQGHFTSLDGSTAAVLTSDHTLLYIRNYTVTSIATDVINFELSVTGDGIVFQGSDDTLYHYHADSNTANIIQETNPGMMDYAISPDGKTVAFLRLSDQSDAVTLWIHENGQSRPRAVYTGNTHYFISVSNQAEFIYTHDSATITCYSNQTQNMIGTLPASLSEHLTYSNADHTQLLLYQIDGTYLSVNGQVATRISSEQVRPIPPDLTQPVCLSNTYTEPVVDFSASLYRKIVMTDLLPLPAFTIWSINNEGICQQLINDVAFVQLDATGQYLYYRTANNDLYLLDRTRPAKSLYIASDVTQFAAACDNNALFYTTADALYILNATGESASIPMRPQNTYGSLLLATADNHLYRVENLTTNFPSVSMLNGSGGWLPIMQNIRTFHVTASGLLYIDTEKGCYLCVNGELMEIMTH